MGAIAECRAAVCRVLSAHAARACRHGRVPGGVVLARQQPYVRAGGACCVRARRRRISIIPPAQARSAADGDVVAGGAHAKPSACAQLPPGLHASGSLPGMASDARASDAYGALGGAFVGTQLGGALRLALRLAWAVLVVVRSSRCLVDARRTLPACSVSALD